MTTHAQAAEAVREGLAISLVRLAAYTDLVPARAAVTWEAEGEAVADVKVRLVPVSMVAESSKVKRTPVVVGGLNFVRRELTTQHLYTVTIEVETVHNEPGRSAFHLATRIRQGLVYRAVKDALYAGGVVFGATSGDVIPVGRDADGRALNVAVFDVQFRYGTCDTDPDDYETIETFEATGEFGLTDPPPDFDITIPEPSP